MVGGGKNLESLVTSQRGGQTNGISQRGPPGFELWTLGKPVAEGLALFPSLEERRGGQGPNRQGPGLCALPYV